MKDFFYVGSLEGSLSSLRHIWKTKEQIFIQQEALMNGMSESRMLSKSGGTRMRAQKTQQTLSRSSIPGNLFSLWNSHSESLAYSLAAWSFFRTAQTSFMCSAFVDISECHQGRPKHLYIGVHTALHLSAA